ncbi:MAG TPA: LpqB family beta-propeller domain-containing protein [Acidobacteriota bacterium]|nr:LpqB family beta-propeller domain-containing protein [Acidobacteriota bacterium]
MKKERWQEIERLYNSALEHMPDERAAWLHHACGDESLRKEVESLLACQSEAKGFIESPALDVATQDLGAGQSEPASAALAGRTLSHYRIIEKLGEGGMGVVYKAHDNHLNRPVALKVLPPDKVADPERKRRFVKEARAASALNHPNIVSIYDIDQAEGVDFIAMEYVSGRTLDRQIPHKGMRIGKVLEYAIQMSDALAAAHAAGIIHRDLKPSNVMVSESGQVKILDFGLAKLVEKAESGAGVDAPGDSQESSLRTDEGMILGTVSYVSPEQAQGKKLDARTDIFSFGAVLYEMVSGERAFRGDGTGSTLAAIIRDEPRRLEEVVPGVPAELEKVIRRCLRKEPERRFQAISDVAVELRELKEELGSHQKEDQPHLRTRTALRAVLAVLGIAALSAAGWWFLRSKPKSEPPLTAVPFTTNLGLERRPTFSPDGNQVAFQWNGEKEDNWDIYVKSVGSEEPLRLTSGPADDTDPSWSPDGSYIAFLRSTREGHAVYTIPPVGGVERKVYETTYVQRGDNPSSFWGRKLACTPDSKGFVISERESSAEPNSLFLVTISTGEKRRLTSPPPVGYYGDADPSFSPDGRSMSFSRMLSFNDMQLYALDMTPEFRPIGEAKKLTDHAPFRDKQMYGHAWGADGKEIVASVGVRGIFAELWRIPIRESSSPQKVGSLGRGASFPAVSPSARRLVFEVVQGAASSWVIDDPGESTIKAVSQKIIASTVGYEYNCQVSPDGKKIAMHSTRTGRYNIWVCNSDGSGFLMLTDRSMCGSPAWSPDSRSIAFDTREEGQTEIYVVSAEGGPVRRITNHPSEHVNPSWSRDGRWMYFTSNRTGRWEIWKTSPGRSEPVQVTHKGGFYAQESLDGKALFYGKEIFERGVYRMPVEGGEETMFLPDASALMFAPTAKGFYYWSAKRELIFLESSTVRSRVVAVIDKTPTSYLSAFPDGKRLLYSQVDQTSSDLYLVENFR